MKIGYARVSTNDQSTQAQIDALVAAGCEKIFTEVASGANKARPKLAETFQFAREGDVISCDLPRVISSSLN